MVKNYLRDIKQIPNYILKPGITTKPENEGTGLGLWLQMKKQWKEMVGQEINRGFEGFKN